MSQRELLDQVSVTFRFNGVEMPNRFVPAAYALSGAVVGVFPAPAPPTEVSVEAIAESK
jgi:hypothetical protein